jgi:hypothetical protein
MNTIDVSSWFITCSCLRLAVASDRPRRGLTPHRNSSMPSAPPFASLTASNPRNTVYQRTSIHPVEHTRPP